MSLLLLLLASLSTPIQAVEDPAEAFAAHLQSRQEEGWKLREVQPRDAGLDLTIAEADQSEVLHLRFAGQSFSGFRIEVGEGASTARNYDVEAQLFEEVGYGAPTRVSLRQGSVTLHFGEHSALEFSAQAYEVETERRVGQSKSTLNRWLKEELARGQRTSLSQESIDTGAAIEQRIWLTRLVDGGQELVQLDLSENDHVSLRRSFRPRTI